ncbi:MAG: WD40 repeat protein [Phenylobacterium sp.]|jgi:WD40 repeat protein
MKLLVTNFTFVLLLFTLILSGCSREHSNAVSWNEHAVDSSYTATLSLDGRYAIVSSIHHGLSFWDVEKNALKYQWSHQGSDNNLVLVSAISANNSHVLTADRENFVLWDIATGKAVGFYKVRESNIRDIALSNDGKHILIGKSSGVVVHITLSSGRRLEFLGHQEKINSVDMTANGRFALTGSNDYVAYLWDTQSGQVIHRFNHPSRVTKVALDVQGRYIFTADSKKQAQIWDMLTGKAISRLQYAARQNVFSAVRFSPSGKFLATGAPSRKLTLWDVQTGEKQQSWTVAPRKNSRPKGAVVHSVTFINDESQLLSESSSGMAEVWDIDK